jgi:hypothetical protein
MAQQQQLMIAGLKAMQIIWQHRYIRLCQRLSKP